MFAHIVYLAGDEASPVIDALYERESATSVVYHGPSDESVAAAIQTLSDWDYGDYGDVSRDLGNGSADDVFYVGPYVLTSHLGLGYVSLSRVLFPSDRVRGSGDLRAHRAHSAQLHDAREFQAEMCSHAYLAGM